MPRKKTPDLRVVGNQPDRVEQFVKDAVETKALQFREMVDHITNKCESPIEKLLMVALYADHESQPFFQVHFEVGELPEKPAFDQAAFIFTQAAIGPYRADIVVWDATLPFEIGSPRLMIVECDGHDFHERTKEQARRDKQRDRYFQSRGFKVLRFTGSEIWADPDACAAEVYGELAIDDDWRNRQK